MTLLRVAFRSGWRVGKQAHIRPTFTSTIDQMVGLAISTALS